MAVVLITGCSSGIGLATAAHLAAAGDRVVATARNPEQAPLLQQLMASESPPVAALTLDVTDEHSVRRAVAEAVEREGVIDVLVNNAGIGASGPVETVDLELVRRVMETNYLGALRMIQAVLPRMRERGNGTIVNVTSIAGRVAMGTSAPYSASKFALEAASEALAQEVVRFGIRVAIIEPGVVLTPIFSKSPEPPDPDSPYWPMRRRLLRFFEARLQSPTMPTEVAKAIEHAIRTEEPRLRYPVGPDAEILAASLHRVSDEERLRLAAIADDEEYLAEATRVMGSSILD